jgi:hypothetical protein
MLLSVSDYERCFRGFSVTDCGIRDRNILYLVTISDYPPDEEPPSDTERDVRVVIFFPAKPPSKRWSFVSFEGLENLQAGGVLKPLAQFVGVDRGGQVVAFGSGTNDLEESIPKGRQGPGRGGIRKTRTLDGLLHVSTGYRGFGRRDGRNQWTSLCAGLDFEPAPGHSSLDYGFDDFDAFSPQDYYCVGGDGDVWHFDGKAWDQLEFPSNMRLETVCCAGDGWVYIGGVGGSVWKGRRDEWKLIHRDRMTLPFKDMVWFQDRVYCTSDYGLWEIVDDQLHESKVPDEVKICSGNLAVADGVMLLAGAYGASYHDGRTWNHLFNTTAFPPKTP